MKIEIAKKPKVFRPITLNIIIETKEELEGLYRSLDEAPPHIDSTDPLYNVVCDLWKEVRDNG